MSEKKIYDLSTQTQSADKQRILKSTSGKEYNVSFVPAIVNRKYFDRWQEIKKEFSKAIPRYQGIITNIKNLEPTTEEDQKFVDEFKKLSRDGVDTSSDLIVYVMKANGYSDFTDEELYENFSIQDIDKSVYFIMGMEGLEELTQEVVEKAKKKKQIEIVS